MIRFFSRLAPQLFTIQTEPWTAEDTDDLKTILSLPKAHVLIKLIHKRMHARTEDLVNGQDTRPRIDELRDLILELHNYDNP